MSKAKGTDPEITKYVEKRVQLKLSGNRKVEGVLRGFDPFMNLALEESFEIRINQENEVERESIGTCVIRGNSVDSIECLERI